MPYDSQGKFTRLHNWEQDRIDGIEIVTDHHDEEDNNFATGLNECLLRDGRVPLEGNLDLGGFKVTKLGNATTASDAVCKSQLDEAKQQVMSGLNSSFLVGDVKCSALQSDHKNWLLCNGRAVLRSSYAELFAAIGTAFGSGDGSTTFNLPDCRGVVVRGLDNGRGLDSNRQLGSYQDDQLQNHIHSLTGAQSQCAGGSRTIGIYYASDSTSDSNFKASGGATGRVGSETRMKNIALNYFIKAKGE